MLANEALDVVNKGVASAEDTDLAMLRGVNYPRGPLARAALGWRHILATLENLQRYYGEARYRPMPLLRRYASPPLSREPNDERQYAARAGSALRRTDVSARYLRSGDGDAHRCRRRRIRSGQHDSRPADAQRPPDLPQRPAVQLGGHRLRLRLQQPGLAAVASGCSIDFVRPALAGDRLTASAEMRHQGKATGLYDVEIVNQRGKTVARFRGRAHRLGHSILGDQA